MVPTAVWLWILSPPHCFGLYLEVVMRSLTASVVGGRGSGYGSGAVGNSFLLLFLIGGVSLQCGVSELIIFDAQLGVLGVEGHRVWCLHLLNISEDRAYWLLRVLLRNYGSEGHRCARCRQRYSMVGCRMGRVGYVEGWRKPLRDI